MRFLAVLFVVLFMISSCDSINNLERKIKTLEEDVCSQKEEINNLKNDLKIYHHYIDQRMRRVEMKSS